MTSNQYELANPPGDAITSLTFAPATSSSPNRLLVSSWDLNLHLYDLSNPSAASLLRSHPHPAPLLDACFGADEKTAFTASIDFAVRRIDLESGEQTILSIHDAPASALAYDSKHNILYSASWDKTLHIHHFESPTSIPATVPLPAKPLSLAISPTKLVVSMTGRLLHIYDLEALHQLSVNAAQDPPNTVETQPLQERESSLKFMIRAIAARPDDSGYVCASIEGRVAVEWFDADPQVQAKKYAFKCHRQPNTAGGEDAGDIVYPVHALACHPQFATFATGGGDGVVALWDAVNKRRIRQYQRHAEGIAGLAFSGDGRLLAVGVSSGFEDGGSAAGADAGAGAGAGAESGPGGGGGDASQGRPARLFVRELGEGEARGKEKK